jgi:hypothetical protein
MYPPRMRALRLLSLIVLAWGGAALSSPVSQAAQAPQAASQGTPTPAQPPALDEAAVKTRSHAFFDALDYHDATFADALGPAFVLFQNERFLDKATMAAFIKARHDRNAPVRTRTWNDEHVFLSATVAVFVGESVEHIRAEADRKPIDQEGWHTLVWVPDGPTWKIAHYQWQKGGIDVERDTWNERFRQSTGFKLTPNQLLVDAVKGRAPGTALDLLMGQGRNAVYLASQHWKVTGVDISDVGIQIANENAARQQLTLETIQANIDEWDLGTNKWDLVTMIYAGADAKLAERVKTSLKTHGLFVTEYFHEDSMNAKAGAGGWKTGELAALFKDGFKILRDEVVQDTADWSLTKQKLVRFVAEKQ